MTRVLRSPRLERILYAVAAIIFAWNVWANLHHFPPYDSRVASASGLCLISCGLLLRSWS